VLFVWFVVLFCSFVGRRVLIPETLPVFTAVIRILLPREIMPPQEGVVKDCGNFLREK
jgi:hypothetical protein